MLGSNISLFAPVLSHDRARLIAHAAPPNAMTIARSNKSGIMAHVMVSLTDTLATREPEVPVTAST